MKRIPLLALCFAVVTGCNGNNPIDPPNTGGGSAGTGGGSGSTGGGAAGTGGGSGSTGGGTAGSGGGGTNMTDAGTPDGGTNTGDAGVVVVPDAGQFDPQVPPLTSAEEIKKWIAAGFYKSWKCEPERNATRGAHHGPNRICSNNALSAHGDGEYPIGAVGFKELYDAAGKINGYAIEVKTKKNSDVANPGAAWFWFEELNGGVIANAEGFAGCTGCHSAAGTGMRTGHDYVYTQIK